jgi:hypothetical protein
MIEISLNPKGSKTVVTLVKDGVETKTTPPADIVTQYTIGGADSFTVREEISVTG